MKRALVAVGIVLTIAAALLWVLQPAQPAQQPAAEVVIGDSVVQPLGLVSVAVDGREVYRDSMHSFTPLGFKFLGAVLTYSVSYSDHYPYSIEPMRGMLGVRYSNGSDGVLVSTIGKSWGYNSTHSGFFITASFVAPEDVQLKWFAIDLANLIGRLTIFNESLTGQASSGSPVAVTLMLYWRDNGALMESWLRYLNLVFLQQSFIGEEFTADNGDVLYAGCGTMSNICPWFHPEYTRLDSQLGITVALGTDCRANPNRTLHSLFNEVARVTPAVLVSPSRLSISFTIPTDNICEIGVLRRVRGYVGSYFTVRNVLVLRWSPGQPLPRGTTVTIYLLRGD